MTVNEYLANVTKIADALGATGEKLSYVIRFYLTHSGRLGFRF